MALRDGGAKGNDEGERVMILAPIVRGRKGEFRKLFEQLAAEGFVRVRVDKQMRQLDEEIKLDRRKNHTIEAVVDRLLLKPGNREPLGLFHRDRHEARQRNRRSSDRKWRGTPLLTGMGVCGLRYEYSCPRATLVFLQQRLRRVPACRGLGSQYTFDPAKVIVDWSRPLLEGGLGPGAGSGFLQRSLTRAAEQIGFDLKTPFERLPRKIQNLLLYGKISEGAPASTVFSGILPLLDRWYGEASSESYREWYSQYMSAVPCPKCQGKRLKPESLAVKVMNLSIADLTALPVIKTQEALAGLTLTPREKLVARRIVTRNQRTTGISERCRAWLFEP